MRIAFPAVAILLTTIFAFVAWTAPLQGNEPTPDALKVTIERPAKSPTLADVNDSEYVLTLTIQNISKKDVLIWPFAEVQVFDHDGKLVPYSGWIGRFGGRDAGPLLEALSMETLRPGQTYRIVIGLGGYQSDEKALTSWKLPSAGEYALGIRYRYDRERVKKDYAEGMSPKKLDDEKMPWNLAIEIDKSISIPLVVK